MAMFPVCQNMARIKESCCRKIENIAVLGDKPGCELGEQKVIRKAIASGKDTPSQIEQRHQPAEVKGKAVPLNISPS